MAEVSSTQYNEMLQYFLSVYLMFSWRWKFGMSQSRDTKMMKKNRKR